MSSHGRSERHYKNRGLRGLGSRVVVQGRSRGKTDPGAKFDREAPDRMPQDSTVYPLALPAVERVERCGSVRANNSAPHLGHPTY